MKTLKQKNVEIAEALLEKQIKAMKNESKNNAEEKAPKKRGRKKKEAPTQSTFKPSDMETFVEQHNQNQSAKADCGKPQLSLVPTKILEAIARVREYGNRKYKSKDNWKTVEIERYRDAAFRHWAKYIDDPQSRDEESGLPHLWHVACNIAFLVSLEDYDGI